MAGLGYWPRGVPNKKDVIAFGEAIVRECIYTIQMDIVRNGHTPENERSRKHIRAIAEKFDIDLPMNPMRGIENVS